ncbi:hypothetical protein FPY71_03695 [Aureimonas fodinaquatilis]|uniref:Translocation and assembly module TamB C-terminal domain-containing protein n=1 Tax=Aureimonas fodinaquatilis TaxID=2565783 RepID=A0A5B0E1P6_9HYPH|nr:translocation/assembly module TamB domain-containing protein [Aureimonas fodinaquatilis]KAA0972222.1 hypothetical protein FPY71_03695 [Aureimonas fodinaquatilis]
MGMFGSLRSNLLALATLAMVVCAPGAANAQGFLARQIENLISTDNAQVKITGFSGAFSGEVRIESLTVADADGVYLTANDLAMDWSPTALIRRTVDIENLSAASIVLDRLPIGSADPVEAESSGGFSLPNITANVQQIAIGRFTLGEAVAGVPAELSAKGSLQLSPQPTSLNVTFDVERQDRPGSIAATLAFAPADNRLGVDISANEPEGGIVAGLLKLADSPAIALNVKGEGPLGNFNASGTLDIAGERATTLTATVQDEASGRRINADINTITGPFVPETYADMVGDTAHLVADVLLQDQGGQITINRGELLSGSLQLDASGVYDPTGAANDLRVSLATDEGNPLPLAFGDLGSRTSIEVSSLDATLAGSLSAARLNVMAASRNAGYQDYIARDVNLHVVSQGFDLNNIAGPFEIRLDAASATAPQGIAANVLTGPVSLTASGSLTADEIVIDADSVSTATASAAVTGRAARDFATFDLALRSNVESAALGAEVPAYAGERLSLQGAVQRTADGFAGRDIVLQGTGLDVRANASLQGETVSASATGTLDQSAQAEAGLSGTADLKLNVSGTLSAPQVELSLNGADLIVAGRTLQEIAAEINGTFAADAPQGTVSLQGVYNNAPLALSADFATEGQVRHFRNLLLEQGQNRVSGEVSLSAANVPTGQLQINAPDISTLAALAGQEASGGAQGQVNLQVAADGTPQAAVQLTAQTLSIAGSELAGANIDVTLFDYLVRPQASGSIEATSVATSSINVAGLSLDLARLNGATNFEGGARINDVPTRLAGQVNIAGGITDIRLNSLTANIENAAISLSEPARIRIGQGRIDLGTLLLNAGQGTLRVQGNLADEADLQVALDRFPLAIANPFVEGLDAAGSLSGMVTLAGPTANLRSDFDLALAQLQTAQTRAANIPGIDGTVAGRLRDKVATLDAARVQLGSGIIEATGQVGATLDTQLRITDLPVALTNGFVEGLGASGTISGTATATGALDNPVVEFQINGREISARQLAASQVPPSTLDVSGRLSNHTVRLSRAVASLGNGSVEAVGSVGRDMDLQLTVNSVPVALANAFVPGLGASGTVSGKGTATGTLGQPQAIFELAGSGLSAAPLRQSGVDTVALDVAGTYRDDTLTLARARVQAGGGTLDASGSIGRTMNMRLALNSLPLALANIASPTLGAQGTLSGEANATGSVSSPQVAYNLSMSGFSIAQARDAGVGPLNGAFNGNYAGNRVTLNGNVSGSGIQFTANGAVNLAGTPAFDIAVNGNAPLALANQFLAEGGRSIQGDVNINARIAGTAASPDVTGTISTTGARFVDTGVNLAVENITTTIALSGNRATFNSFSAALGSGGTINVSGGIGLGAGFPADLTITIRDGRYADGELFSTRLNADLTVTGPLTGAAVLGGTINAQEINIVVPDSLPSSLAQLDVRYVNAPAAVLRQQQEINPDSGATGTSGGGISLNVTLNAPNRVFVRGRGLDLELGGSIQIAGPLSNLGIVGSFDLERGYFQILSRRLEFQRASLSFTGNLIPTLDFLAESDAGQARVYVAVRGPAENPTFTFSSNPALPQDEVLAQLIFGQSTSNLSPVQIAQLASAAASLAGVGGSTGLLDNLRSKLGVDNLDITTTEDGQAAVGVGQYLNDKTYVGVDSTGRVSIDLDLGRDFKARGAVTATGGGEVGVFYEKEY